MRKKRLTYWKVYPILGEEPIETIVLKETFTTLNSSSQVVLQLNQAMTSFPLSFSLAHPFQMPILLPVIVWPLGLSAPFNKVPDDIQLISFNDTSLAKQVFPPLSTITVFTEEMGRTAMDVLNKQVLAPREIPTLTMLGTKLTLRESTKNG